MPTDDLTPGASRAFHDVDATRTAIYDNVLKAAQTLPPVTDGRYSLALKNPAYIDPPLRSRREHKEALLTHATLGRRLKGTWVLADNAGNVLDQREQVVARVPHLTDQGTFVRDGVDNILRNQQRLKPGVYTRRKNNGELEGHVNVLAGEGRGHRYTLDPDKGIFHINIGQASIPLMPLLGAMGATDQELRAAWGADVHQANAAKANDASALTKLAARVLHKTELTDSTDAGTRNQRLVRAFADMRLDPEVTQSTLGHPFKGLDKHALLAVTSKLLKISRGEADPDDRDALPYQNFVGPEDLLAERLAKDHGRMRRQLLFKIAKTGDLSKVPSGALTAQLEHPILYSGLGNAPEEVNPAELLDKRSSVTRMGEGGISALTAIPDEARSVQNTHYGFIDPTRTPESEKIGVDLYFASGARKGTDGRIHAPFQEARTGKTVWKTPQELAQLSVAFPGQERTGSKRVLALKGGKLTYVPRNQVDLTQASFESSFSPLGNLVPFKSASQAQRTAMGSRMATQALSLLQPEAPLVQSGVPGSGGARSFEEEYGRYLGAVHARGPGSVRAVTPDAITVQRDDGTQETIELYNNLPYSRKTFFHQTPVVKPGDRLAAGQLLARSNYTDEQGTTALGLNARVAYWPYEGRNHEDAIVISESMAKRMTSTHAYQHDLQVDERTRLGKKHFISLFPSKFSKEALAKLDHDGVIKVGETVEYGEPLIAAAREREFAANKVHKKRQAGFDDNSILWEHHDRGVVTDVARGKNGPVVVVKATSAMQEGDKASNRHGGKGIVSHIIPDAKMPHDKDGKPFEVLLAPDGLVSRANPSQAVEVALGKLAQHLGHPIKVADFEGQEDLAAWAHEQLRRHGLSPTEDLYWPERDIKVPGVFTGTGFFMKLAHQSEGKEQARDAGSYSSDEAPAKGGPSGSKRISVMDLQALLAHNAVATLRDVGAFRGQKNEDLWLQFMQGHNPDNPKEPLVYTKFINYLKGAGLNVVRRGTKSHLMAMTDKDVDALAGDHNILNADTVNIDKGMAPVRGGLFDPQITGAHNSKQWAALPLDEPMPSPVMEDPIRHLLGLTKKQFEGVLAGEHELPRFGSGPEALSKALESLNVTKEIALARMQIQSGHGALRDTAARKLGYLKSAQALGIHPRDWLLKRVPVLPTLFRPISMLGQSGIPVVADPNLLYKELFTANENLKAMKKAVGPEGAGNERLAVYNAFKAVTGLGDPLHPKLVAKNVSGLLQSIFGKGSPKFSVLQRKLLSSTVDQVGRGVVSVNPDYDMDTIGVPETMAFDIYKKPVVRRLRRHGMPITQALQQIKDKTDLARKTLVEEMDDRPVIMNRSPVLHKFGILAFKPKLVTGHAIQVSPLVVSGLAMDFDGDQAQIHVLGSEDARREALTRLLPSKNLLSPADFKTPVHTAGQAYIGGTFYGTSPHLTAKKAPRLFHSKADVIEAWKHGEIRGNDPVVVLE